MTASEKLLSLWRDLIGRLESMDPSAVTINLGLTALIVIFAIGVLYGLRHAVRRGTKHLQARSAAVRTLRGSLPARLAAWLIQLVVVVVALDLAAGIWGLDLLGTLRATLGEATVGSALRFAVLLIVGIAAYELVGMAIRRAVARIALHQNDSRRRAQWRTLGPLLMGIARVVIAVIVGLMLLGTVGIDVGPLIAGAGIAGIAIGFGAQTLVKDFLTGLFLLVEDIVSVGDVVRIGDSGGLVEQMTLRTVWLRDFDGTLHVFPYSEAQVIHNMTKTFSCYVLNLQISYSSDIDRAIEIMKQIGAEMQADAAYTASILEPIEVVGVDALADSGVVIKARIKTLPIQQWTVGRAYNQRIKVAFDRAGIEIPFPHIKLVLPDNRPLDGGPATPQT